MTARLIALMVGLVLLLVGIVGLLTPVSVSPGVQTVPCGTAVAGALVLVVAGVFALGARRRQHSS